MIRVNVGGTLYTTLLSTLRSQPESLLAQMFDGQEHQRGAGGMMEGVAGGMSTVLVPQLDGVFFIDRHGPSFEFILTFLRDGADAALPSQPTELRQLGVEARHFRLDELVAMCAGASGCTVNSLPTLVEACGGGATPAEIAALSDAEVTRLLQDHTVNVLFAKRIRAQVGEERERVRLEAEAEAARLAALAEAERNLERLRAELTRGGCEVSEAGLLTLVAAGMTLRAVSELDAAAAAALGLPAEDARLVGALELLDPLTTLTEAASLVTAQSNWSAVGGHPHSNGYRLQIRPSVDVLLTAIRLTVYGSFGSGTLRAYQGPTEIANVTAPAKHNEPLVVTLSKPLLISANELTTIDVYGVDMVSKIAGMQLA